MADFEKVRAGHERWCAQWPALAGGTTVARANRARVWGRGP